MANWTQQELEELMAKMTKKAMTDAEFRKEVLADATAALEKLAGKPLPDGVSLKCIERDPNYQSTFVLPDLVDEEKIDDDSLQQVAGGISVALIVSVCGAAAGVGPEAGVCAAKACPADGCIAEACAAHACAMKRLYTDSHSCAAEACPSQIYKPLGG
jgi:hypothetical protein